MSKRLEKRSKSGSALGVAVLGVGIPILAALSYSFGARQAEEGCKVVGTKIDKDNHIYIVRSNGKRDEFVNYQFSAGYSKIVPVSVAIELDAIRRGEQ